MLEENIEMMELGASSAYGELCNDYEKLLNRKNIIITGLISTIGLLVTIIMLLVNNKEGK